MTPEEITRFREAFKKIVYLKGEMIKNNKHIARLTRYDKNGSHKKALLKMMDIKRKNFIEYKLLLSGTTYEDWLKKSYKLTVLQRMLKKVSETKQLKYQQQLDEL